MEHEGKKDFHDFMKSIEEELGNKEMISITLKLNGDVQLKHNPIIDGDDILKFVTIVLLETYMKENKNLDGIQNYLNEVINEWTQNEKSKTEKMS